LVLKVLFGASVFVAAFIEAHPEHRNSLPWLQRVRKKDITGVVSVHSLLEIYPILTTLTLSPDTFHWQLT